MRAKPFRAAVLIAVFTLVASACGSGTPETATTVAPSDVTGTTAAGETATTTPVEPAEPTIIRAAITGDEDTINPYTYISGFPGWNLLMLQYDSIMQFDVDGIPQPWLAESITVNADSTEFVVTLVDGVTWHDGMPLTASDVEFTFAYFVEHATGRFARDLKGVGSVTVQGDLEITITLSAPNPAFDLGVLADVPIIPQHIWENVDNPEDHVFDTVTNVGSGPFMLVDYAEDQSYRFIANPDYFRGVPAVDELIVIVFAADVGALAAIRSGEVDVSFERISPEQIDLLGALDGIEISQGPEFTTQMINFDVSRAPFDDLAVRQAISLAVDRQDIVDTIFLGAATVGSPGWVHPSKTVYNPAVVAVHDVAAANSLLDEAGYLDTDGDGIREFAGGPMSFEMLSNASDSLRLRIAELTAEMLAQIGIEVIVASVETATWEQAVWPGFDINNGRNYEMAVWGWSSPVQADTIRIVQLVHSDPDVGFLNLTGFASAEADALSVQLQTETDSAKSAQLIADLQVVLAEQVPFVLLAYPDGAYAYNADVYDGWEFITGQGIVSKISLLPPEARP